MTAVLIPKTTVARKGQVARQWFVVDADGLILGRLASDLATILMGKHKANYTPHVDVGDFIIVLNAEKIRVTGRKAEQKSYDHYTYHPGGRKVISYDRMMEKHPERIIEMAVRRMLPKTRLGRAMFKKMKVYCGSKHEHQAQQPVALDLSAGLKKALC